MLQAGMYSTPIIYSITYIIQRGHLSIAKVMMMNPLAQIIQELRHFIVYSGATINWDIFDNKLFTLIPIIISVGSFIVGYTVFKRNAKKFAEIL